MQRRGSRGRADLAWPVIILLSAVSAEYATRAMPVTPVRSVILGWFLFICPGMVIIQLINLRQPLTTWMLAMSGSIVVDTATAAALVYAGRWSASAVLSLVTALSVCSSLALLFVIIRALRSEPLQLAQEF